MKFEGSDLVYGTIPPPVYGSYYGTNMGNTAGNSYQGIKPKAGETFVYLPWMLPKKATASATAAVPVAAEKAPEAASDAKE